MGELGAGVFEIASEDIGAIRSGSANTWSA